MKYILFVSLGALLSACQQPLILVGPGPSNLCTTDSDCVPSSCCHASQCSSKGSAPNCDNVACTLECRPGTLDCGGNCHCIKNKCTGTLEGPTKESCEAAGGSWQRRYIGEFCNFPASDFGQPCNSSEQCEGECVADTINANAGHCSEFKTVFGCVTLLENGKAVGVCID